MYVSAGLGIAGQVVAARRLGAEQYGLLAIVLAAAGFAQSFLDITVEEAVIKFGFRYIVAEEWGKLRRLFARALRFKILGGVLAAVVLLALAPTGNALFGHAGLFVPIALAGLIPLAQSPEGIATDALLLRNRYDIRAFFNIVNMGSRFAALAVGSRISVTATVAFVVLAQVVSTSLLSVVAWNAYSRFPRVAAVPLGSDRAEIVRFMKQSTLASTMVTLQGAIVPLLLGIVTSPAQVGLYRVALAPQTAFAAISSPIRLILLTEQTRHWEKGNIETVFAAVRRFSIGATALLAVLLPPLLVFMPDIVRLVYGRAYDGAVDGARLVLVASALTTAIGWSKSLPVSIGRPGLRVLTHGIQALVVIPLTVVLGLEWGATGAAAALAISSAVFVGVWAILIVGLYRRRGTLATAEATAG